jgi:hypothetical protein
VASLEQIAGGKLYNAHIVLDEMGLKFKLSPETFFSLSEMVQFYSDPKQTELPQALSIA